jgi:hypothetical protein
MFITSIVGSSAHSDDSAGLAPTMSPVETSSNSLSSLRQACRAAATASAPPARMTWSLPSAPLST